MAGDEENEPLKDDQPPPVGEEAGHAPPDAGGKFFIVGIGASAGGLEALSALLKRLQLDSMALVIVQHLAPKLSSSSYPWRNRSCAPISAGTTS